MSRSEPPKTPTKALDPELFAQIAQMLKIWIRWSPLHGRSMTLGRGTNSLLLLTTAADEVVFFVSRFQSHDITMRGTTMLRMPVGLILAVGLLGGLWSKQSIWAGECLKRGDAVGVFYVTKVAGAEDDGVVPGERLCYRCRYGSRPLVMVFARRTGGRLTELVRRLDRAVATNPNSRLKGLVTFVGEDAGELKLSAESVAEKAAVKKVPLVVAKEPKTGPINYKLSADAAITIVVAKDSQVVNTHTYDVDKIDVARIMTDVQQILH